MPNIGPMELIVVLVVALLILGPKRLPAAGWSLGKGVQEFKAGLTVRGDATPQVEPPQAAAVPAAPVRPDTAEQPSPPAAVST